MNGHFPLAPALQVSHWLNTTAPITLEQLRGKVVVLHAFQMLCPGCVAHGLPQAQAIRLAFPEETVSVIGLHTVFEHHDVMGPRALEAFVQEYRLGFPIGVDQADPTGPVPKTMQAYGLEGTPSLLILDKAGCIRLRHFGQVDDLRVGASIGQLLGEPAADADRLADRAGKEGTGCDMQGCRQ